MGEITKAEADQIAVKFLRSIDRLSYRAWIQTAGSRPGYKFNSLRFETHDEAYDYALNRCARWNEATALRITQTCDPVNARWDGELIHSYRMAS